MVLGRCHGAWSGVIVQGRCRGARSGVMEL